MMTRQPGMAMVTVDRMVMRSEMMVGVLSAGSIGARRKGKSRAQKQTSGGDHGAQKRAAAKRLWHLLDFP